MKEIKIIRLKLSHFQGGTFTLETDGKDVDISARNGQGKTRLASAFSWLLFGKDSLGRSSFQIKNINADGEHEHGLNHSVEAELNVAGVRCTLGKVYSEKWTKVRGRAEAEFSGHTTQHFYDGIPIQEKEYLSRIAEIAGDEQIFRLITSPSVFPALPWQKQRALLLDICGDMTDTDVIATDGRLAPLLEMLVKIPNSKKPFDDLKTLINTRKTEINRQIQQLPVRIDEVKRGLPDISGLNQKEVSDKVKHLETSLNDAKLKLSGIDNGSNIADLSKKLSIINADISKLEQAYYTEAMQVANRLTTQINEINGNVDNEARAVKNLKEEIRQRADKVAFLDGELARLREKWTAINAEMFTITVDDTCNACGQVLPSERVQAARDKALALFNQSKAERLTRIQTEGQALSKSLQIAEDDIEALQKQLNERPQVSVDDLVLKGKRDAVKAMAENYDSIPGRDGLIEERTNVELSLIEAKEGVAVDRQVVTEEVMNINRELTAARAEADKFRQREQGEKRIAELKTEEKTLAVEYERLEKELFLCELFIKTKVSLLTEKINAKFAMVRWKLYDVQVNGALNECCVATVNGIPYDSGLNSAARINAGLDICQTLQRHYGLNVPVFIDNAETVCEPLKMDCQVIRLIVSAADKELRVVVK